MCAWKCIHIVQTLFTLIKWVPPQISPISPKRSSFDKGVPFTGSVSPIPGKPSETQKCLNEGAGHLNGPSPPTSHNQHSALPCIPGESRPVSHAGD